MAERQVDQGTAESVVKESLGLTADDLGMDRPNPFDGLDFGEEGGDGEGDVDIDLSEGAGEGEPQPREPQEPQPDPLRVSHTPEPQPRGHMPAASGVKPDRKGNLVNAQGRIVATAGREARLYTEHHKTRQQLAQTVEQANGAISDLRGRLNQAVDIGMQLSARNKAMQEAGNIATQHGLNENEHLQAVQLARQAKTDPVGALKSLLTRAAAAGIDLTSLGLQPGGFDTKSLMDMVRAEIANGTAPVRERMTQESQRETQQREADQARESVNRELSSFLTANPTARQWLPAFKEIYSRPELAKMSLGEVWSRLQLNLLQRGIDPNNPQQQRSPNPPQRRLPNGRGNPPGAGQGRTPPLDLAPVSTSYEDIVRGVLGR